ncbi:MAG TPA: SRPBCC family protein, partial [Polyangiales bacterium]|nr:SRPBCC family protein [Polyangiales bacterium]
RLVVPAKLLSAMYSASVQAQSELIVRRPVERVFPFLADPRNRPRWQASLRTVQMLSEGEPHVGMRWRERPGGLVSFDMQIVALEPNQLWVEQIEGAGITGKIALRFAAEGGNTRIGVSVTLAVPKLLQLGSPVMRTVLVTMIRQDLARVEQLV